MSTHACCRVKECYCEDTHCEGTCVLQNRSIKGCTHGTLTEQGYKVWATCCCCEHTHVCCRMCKFRGAPRSQRLQRSGEPIAAVSIHVCVCCAEYIISGVHQRTKGYKGLTDQLLLRARTHTHTASCRIRKFRAAPEDQGLRRFGRRRAAASIHTLVAE